MKICFSLYVKPNKPCGGGSRFALNLSNYLISKGHEIQYSFDPSNLPDCILFFDHKLYSDDCITKWLSLDHAKLIRQKFPKIPFITRINDIGYPKSRPENFVKNFSELANISNFVIYVSEWLQKDYYKNKIFTESQVIHNCVDEKSFNIKEYVFDKPKLFTHHWSDNRMKGWDIYEKIDKWIADKDIDFTFVGNIPQGVKLTNTKLYPPLPEKEIANIIKQNNIYITASKFEPCGNHFIEGLACGLPLLYTKDSGGTKEFGEYGLEFDTFDDFKIKFDNIVDNHILYYNRIKEKFNNFNYITFNEYEKIFLRLTSKAQ